MSPVVARIVLVVSAIWLLLMLRQLARESASDNWPTADGRVRAVVHRRSGPSVQYEYDVDGHTFRGNDIAAGFASGSTVTVSYDPKDASQSLITTGVRIRTLLDAAVPLLVLLFTASRLNERSSLRDEDPSK